MTSTSHPPPVRCRPWNNAELARGPQVQDEPFFLAEGSMAFSNRRTGPTAAGQLRNVIGMCDCFYQIDVFLDIN